MDFDGSVPEPLLPPDIALQNPHLMPGYSFYVFPNIEKILIMIDTDGNEEYQPMLIPVHGGYPKPIFEEQFADYRTQLLECDPVLNIVYFSAESKQEQINQSYQGNLNTNNIKFLAQSQWGAYIAGASSDHQQIVLLDVYTMGDHVGYLWEANIPEPKLILGTPLEEHQDNQEIPLNSITEAYFTPNNGLLFPTSLFEDAYGLGYFPLDDPSSVEKIEINGILHAGVGEFEGLRHTKNECYSLKFNIDGCSWLYEGVFHEDERLMQIDAVICGTDRLTDGVIEEYHYDNISDRYIMSFSTATYPSQIITVSGSTRDVIQLHTNERILGLSPDLLSPGEDVSFISFDDTQVSARLYIPSSEKGYEPPYPLVYYIHGGPQSQERPDFSWFSMSLIQFLTLKGFAVFVPNVRGSTGYGLSYSKEVDGDWGGNDRLDHAFAMEKVLPNDELIDLSRAGVIGRSYGGYMTLTLAGRHPELWSAAVDMFGPYDLLTFSERLPETWKPYFAITLGDPIDDREFLVERSPNTYINNITFPMLVIQGKNDPRVVEKESRELVE